MAQSGLANTQDLVAIEEIRGSTVIVKGGALRKILIVGGVNFSLKSDAEQTIITQAYQNFLNSVDFPLQIIIHSRKINIEQYLASLDERRNSEPSVLLQDQIAEYREFVKKFVSENAIMSKTFLVVVSFSPINLPSKESFLGFLSFGRKKDAAQEARITEAKQTDFAHNEEQLAQRVARVSQGLAAIGLETAILNNEQLVELFYNFYNPETVEKKEVDLDAAKEASGASHQ